jgi:exosortase K
VAEAGARVKRAIVAALTLAVVLAMKLYYRSASAADLDWILRPTVWLVETVTGFSFVREAGIGYLDRQVGFAIIPPCAGVNFLIVAFASLVLGQLWRARRPLLLFFAAAVPALAATLTANTVRLVIAIELHRHQLSSFHEIEGVVVYVTALLLLTLGANRLIEDKSSTSAGGAASCVV